MRQLTFTNAKGESVTIGTRRPFILESVTGLGEVDAEIQSQKSPYQDGSTFIDALLAERDISINLGFGGKDYAKISKLRSLLTSVFNPKLGEGILEYENDNRKWMIQAIPSVPSFPDNSRVKTIQRSLIQLTCHNPYWMDVTTQNIKLEDFTANFRFPFRFPVKFATRGDSRTIYNEGDVPTPIIVEFRGNAVNPKIVNETTGEFIKVNREIPPNYKLLINTAFGQKSVRIIAPDGVETNAFGWVDLESTFFELGVGANTLSFITEGGEPEVYIEYKQRYVGV